MFEVGRVCVKTAGRDAGKYCAVLEVLDGSFVLIDGETRRRKCNVYHLDPVDAVVDVDKSSSTQDVLALLRKAGLKVCDFKESQKRDAAPGPRPRRARKSSAAAKQQPAEKQRSAEKQKPAAKASSAAPKKK